MSNINLKTIGSLPLAEEVNENTSLVGWDGEKTVRVAKDMVGGGTSDAVQYIPQELTEERQMQARKNLALPYTGLGDVTVVPETTVVTKQIMGMTCGALFVGEDFSGFEVGKEYTVHFSAFDTDGNPYQHNGVYDIIAEDNFEAGDTPCLRVLYEELDDGFKDEILTFVTGYEYVPENIVVMRFPDHYDYTCTVSIIQKNKEIIVPLQPEFLPNQPVVFEELTDPETGGGLGEYKCSHTFEQVRIMYRKNGWVNAYLKIALEDSYGAKRNQTIAMDGIIESKAYIEDVGGLVTGGFMFDGMGFDVNVQIVWENGSDPQVTVN